MQTHVRPYYMDRSKREWLPGGPLMCSILWTPAHVSGSICRGAAHRQASTQQRPHHHGAAEPAPGGGDHEISAEEVEGFQAHQYDRLQWNLPMRSGNLMSSTWSDAHGLGWHWRWPLLHGRQQCSRWCHCYLSLPVCSSTNSGQPTEQKMKAMQTDIDLLKQEIEINHMRRRMGSYARPLHHSPLPPLVQIPGKGPDLDLAVGLPGKTFRIKKINK